MPETMWASKEPAGAGGGIESAVPNGQGLAVPQVGVRGILTSPCPPYALASAWGETLLWVIGSSSPPQPTSPREGDISMVRACDSDGERD